MNILIIGSGGREHALAWKISQSPFVKKIYCAPGNAGIADLAECVDIDASDVKTLYEFAKNSKIDLTVVGPEAPLAAGIVDLFEQGGLKVFGPSQKAARLESSKTFAKTLMGKYNIPAAAGRSFTSFESAQNYIRKTGSPVVIKADGLAAGKGVYVCQTEKEALQALTGIMKHNLFGDAGKEVVVEACLTGEEASFIAFTDGKTVLPLPAAQDHKAIFDDDKGPNTGGMGAYSPAPIVDAYLQNKIMEEVMLPTVQAMSKEGCPYKGVLYAGMMIHKDKIHVLEFNARFGDPEAQPLLMRLNTDIVEIMLAVIEGTLERCKLEIDERAAVCVVLAAKGYPGPYGKGMPITGLEKVRRMKEVMVFHAGTAKNGKSVISNGGRVLGVTALGDTVETAISKVYQAVSKIEWKDVYFRTDIGKKALKRFALSPEVGIVMGSDSDFEVMGESVAVLKQFGIPFEITVASAHRSPHKAAMFAKTAKERGMKVIIAGAGLAAHLAGAIAAHTTLPVIGVPINSPPLNGLDSLLSTVQMPPGIPVATVAIGKAGARNAGLLAAQILATSDPTIGHLLEKFKVDMAEQVTKKAKQFENPR